MMEYLMNKKIFYIGKRKRIYGRSREKKQIGTI
jgi:hypothetical protein